MIDPIPIEEVNEEHIKEKKSNEISEIDSKLIKIEDNREQSQVNENHNSRRKTEHQHNLWHQNESDDEGEKKKKKKKGNDPRKNKY